MNTKRKQLFIGLLLDAIGYASYALPFLGEEIDVVWAPLSAYIMTRMYQGTMGKVGGLIELVEEGLPFTDFIPTFTIMWIYKYIIKKDPAISEKKETVIDI